MTGTSASDNLTQPVIQVSSRKRHRNISYSNVCYTNSSQCAAQTRTSSSSWYWPTTIAWPTSICLQPAPVHQTAESAAFRHHVWLEMKTNKREICYQPQTEELKLSGWLMSNNRHYSYKKFRSVRKTDLFNIQLPKFTLRFQGGNLIFWQVIWS